MSTKILSMVLCAAIITALCPGGVRARQSPYPSESEGFSKLNQLSTDPLFGFTIEHPITYDELGRPKSVVPGDLDGDGDVDVLGYLGETLLWWENIESELTSVHFIQECNCSQIYAIGDVDGDTDFDFITMALDQVNAISWWENDSRGNFAPSIIETDFAGHLQDLVIVDLDQDGDSDLLGVVSNYVAPFDYPSTIAWWENDGEEQFTQHNIETDFQCLWRVYTIDIDNDADIDFVTASGYRGYQIAWWENDSDQNFNSHVVTYGDGPTDVQGVDLDNDGDIDLLGAVNYLRSEVPYGQVIWWENDGSENFAAHEIMVDRGNVGPIYVTDLDYDGDVDIVGASSYLSRNLVWWENDGAQSFTLHVIEPYLLGAFTALPVDLDGDGDLDILGAGDNPSGDGDKVAWWESGARLEYPAHILSNSAGEVTALASADVDGDGDIDLITASGVQKDIAWWENSGTQGFTRHLIQESYDVIGGIEIIDFDHDGDIDIVSAAFSDGDISWWENDGSGFFARQVIDSSFAAVASVYPIDFDKDGDIDVVGSSMRSGTGTVWWENPGFVKHTIRADVFCGSLTVADIEGNGLVDIVGRCSLCTPTGNCDYYSLKIFLNDGPLGFTTVLYPYSLAPPYAVLDLNLDGEVDLVGVGDSLGVAAWLENYDGVHFYLRALSPALVDLNSIDTIDMNRDGDIDVVGSGTSSGDITWLENDGKQGFSAHRLVSNLKGPIAVDAVDLDGDGDLDIVSAAQGANTLIWWEHPGIPPAQPDGLAASAISTTQIEVTWQDNPVDEAAFYVERSVDSSIGWKVVAILPADTVAYIDSDLESGKVYYYRVRAYRAVDASFSGYSNVDSAATFGIMPNRGGNSGLVTIVIISDEHDPDSEVILAHDGQEDIIATKTSLPYPGYRLYATFDLAGQLPGMWDLVINRSDGLSFSFSSFFEIIGGGGADLSLAVLAPASFRLGRETEMILEISNTGLVDLSAVWYEVTIENSLDSQHLMILESGENNLDSQHLVVLESGLINVPPFTTEAVPVPVTFPLPEGCDWNIIVKALAFSQESLDEMDCDELRQLRELTGNVQKGLKNALDITNQEIMVGCCDCSRSSVYIADSCQELCNRKATLQEALSVAENFLLAIDAEMARKGCPEDPVFPISPKKATLPTCVGSPRDPNEKVCTSGIGTSGFVRGASVLPYNVYFENLATANTDATEVLIWDQLDLSLDWTSFKYGTIYIAGHIIAPPDNSLVYSTSIDLRPEYPVLVDISARFDPITGLAQWLLRGRDPITGKLSGFLPPNTNEVAPQGEGSVRYYVTPKQDIPSGTVIHNMAVIDFEVGILPDPLNTDYVSNTIDTDLPTSQVGILPLVQRSSAFEVVWSGNDATSSVSRYTIYVSDNGGPFLPWLTDVLSTTATYVGSPRHTYGFVSIARDVVGNLEIFTTLSDTVTSIPHLVYLPLLLRYDTQS